MIASFDIAVHDVKGLLLDGFSVILEGFSRLKVLVKMPCWILNEPVKSLAFCDGRSFDRFWAICAPRWLRCPPTSVKVNTKEWCLSNTWCVKGVYVKPSRAL